MIDLGSPLPLPLDVIQLITENVEMAAASNLQRAARGYLVRSRLLSVVDGRWFVTDHEMPGWLPDLQARGRQNTASPEWAGCPERN